MAENAPDFQLQGPLIITEALKKSELISFSLSYIKPLQGEIISRLTKDALLSTAWIYSASARSQSQIKILLCSHGGRRDRSFY